MFLKKLNLTNFRNFAKFSLDFSQFNIITGPNGRGKTNLLEAIYLLSSTKSFRPAKNSDLVLWGKDFARLEARIKDNDKKLKIEFMIDLRPDRKLPKIVKIDDRARKLFFVIGKLKTVMFSPESLDIVLGAPSFRRRFLDFLICQHDPKYAKYLLYFMRVLKNRNIILAKINQGLARVGELDFWSQELIDYGGFIILSRQELISKFNRHLSEKYQEIAGKNQALKIEYKNTLTGKNLADIKAKFSEKLKLFQQREIIFQKTIVGPQRDNLIFKIDDKNINHFGSRGEIRTAVLALKMAEVDFLVEDDNYPLLLLDDAFSELDEQRRNFLVQVAQSAQTIISSCDLKTVPESLKKKAKIIKL
ncbi:MAG TPA: DNA replication/repair protein RecF [Patescibacteria group bacterium]|nr:DNA replication/repair protein RecF [Patescibacteria group bacterium]